MHPKRVGIVVWLRNLRDVRHLERYGHLIYVSKRMKYAVLYVNQSELKAKLQQLTRLPFVRKVEQSYLHEVPVDYKGKKSAEEPAGPTEPVPAAVEVPPDGVIETFEAKAMEEKI